MAPADRLALGRLGRSPAPGAVVHVVGRITESVFSFLGPASAALARSDVDQFVLTLDDAGLHRLIPRLHPSVQVLTADPTGNPLRRWARLRSMLRELTEARPVASVHLHGALPCLLGALQGPRLRRLRVRVHFSPHSSRSLGSLRWFGWPFRQWLRPQLQSGHQQSIANVPHDAQVLQGLTEATVHLVESPVADVFFLAPRQLRAQRPLVIGGVDDNSGRSAILFAQLAVLLGDENLGLSFHWVGPADAVARAQFKAAKVAVLDPLNEAGRAARLAEGWVYVAVGSARGFPLALAEAMAAGLPCVALDAGPHRDMIEPKITGLICVDQGELVQAVAQLIDQEPLRARLGKAARVAAHQRFHGDRFRRRLLAAYDVEPNVRGPMEEPPPARPARTPPLIEQRSPLRPIPKPLFAVDVAGRAERAALRAPVVRSNRKRIELS